MVKNKKAQYSMEGYKIQKVSFPPCPALPPKGAQCLRGFCVHFQGKLCGCQPMCIQMAPGLAFYTLCSDLETFPYQPIICSYWMGQS